MIASRCFRALTTAAVLAALAPSQAQQGTKSSAASAQPAQIFPPGIYPLTPEREQALKQKDSFKECDGCPEMVVVPKGTFTMGTPASEPERDDGEGPQHRVTIRQDFAVGRFAISNDEWQVCVADGGCDAAFAGYEGPGGGRLPVSHASFEAAKAYLTWISRKTNRTYRLPSESEREYFTRAGTATPFWFGKTVSSQQANFRASQVYAKGPRGEDSKGLKPIDSYAPNKFGLYQVSGNSEWTEDCFNKRYTQDTPTDGSPWLDGDCTRRMVRGGDWNGWPTYLRSGYRTSSPVIGSSGLRVIRTLNVAR